MLSLGGEELTGMQLFYVRFLVEIWHYKYCAYLFLRIQVNLELSLPLSFYTFSVDIWEVQERFETWSIHNTWIIVAICDVLII